MSDRVPRIDSGIRREVRRDCYAAPTTAWPRRASPRCSFRLIVEGELGDGDRLSRDGECPVPVGFQEAWDAARARLQAACEADPALAAELAEPTSDEEFPDEAVGRYLEQRRRTQR